MPACHRILECTICKKMMRSDNLKRHCRSKHKMFGMESTIRVEGKTKIDKSPSIVNELRFEMLNNGKLFDEKISLGRHIYNLLMETSTKEESLSPPHKEALDLYQRKRLSLSLDDEIALFNWQKALLELVHQPTYREVIWVKGARGNEGKTWFQNYLQTLLGSEKVVQLDLKNSVGNIMHILRKLPLSSVDTFLFNDARSGQSEMRCYEVLENIKDGRAIASKYASEVIRFRTPNLVIVFSNADPDMAQLSRDRWKVLFINKDGLSSQENRLWEQRHSNKKHYKFKKY